MANWTFQDLNAYARRQANSQINRKPRPIVQKSQDVDAREANHGPQKTSLDGQRDRQFSAAITFFVSDKRERDGDGGEATILDCLIATRKRLVSLPDSVLMALYEDSKRPGGC